MSGSNPDTNPNTQEGRDAGGSREQTDRATFPPTMEKDSADRGSTRNASMPPSNPGGILKSRATIASHAK